METILKQEYRGWIIQEETCLWSKRIGPIRFFNENHEGQYFNALTVEEAQAEIDEKVICDLMGSVTHLEKKLAQKESRIAELEKLLRETSNSALILANK